ncbi:MAG: S1/P1 nuclease [Alphaproteobacteria bacterium]|nr:S1/P1 nuclease [Alphaproteobacteria bacterium]MBV9418615.1 S1/P1 nuclease [Alphaproteobacteria bacterium]
MRRPALAAVLLLASTSAAFAWGSEGHSIVAEIANRRLSPEAFAEVERLMGKGHSLASVSSWADDIRGAHPESYNWHFVDISIADTTYDPATECKPDPKGDCVIAELERLRQTLRCGTDDAAKLDALRFTVHFIGDIHQPLHTVNELRGGNDIAVKVTFKGNTCRSNCEVQTNFHAAWDSTLIQRTVWDWGAYVDKLEAGWLTTPEALDAATVAGTPTDWALQTHAAAQTVWNAKPESNELDDAYYTAVLPVLDKQLGLGGLRLAKFLNDAYASTSCPVAP